MSFHLRNRHFSRKSRSRERDNALKRFRATVKCSGVGRLGEPQSPDVIIFARRPIDVQVNRDLIDRRGINAAKWTTDCLGEIITTIFSSVVYVTAVT